ncbi:MAG: phospho-sugar mutase [Sphaerochaetaceae bacterium]|jgi:phosphoglucomutase
MELSEKEKDEVVKKANEYIEQESEALFRNEVINALDEQAFDELYDRFYTSLSFGTAGMRGVIGGGSNRINPLMIRKVTQGLADYLNESFENPVMAIAFDSRNYSELFARQAALTLCANNIKVYLYQKIRPVPLLSFALKHLKANAGIVITASHNPAKYNGYKVYWDHGGQVTEPHDNNIVEAVNKVDPTKIKSMDYAEALEKKLLVIIGKETDEHYYDMVLNSLNTKLFEKNSVTVAYTPLHGSGNKPVRTLLDKLGVECKVVENQELPDGNFPTVSMPNPEDPQAMRLAIELAINNGSDIVLGTDPDADRLGIAIPTDQTKTEYQLLNGNQIAVLLVDYLLQKDDKANQAVVVKSIVTTDLVKAISEKHKATSIDVLTGFKYIAQEIERLETSKDQHFLFGCEESYGYLFLPYLGDKDAVSAALLSVEMLIYYNKMGKTIQQRLEEIYTEFGIYSEKVLSYTYEGASGQQKMASIMASFREKQVGSTFADLKIKNKIDLLNDKGTGLPPSDVIILEFESDEKLIIRPSGTEPKIKYYLFFKTPYSEKGELDKKLDEKVSRIKSEL